MNLRQLELFLEVIKHGSITKTAETLDISQPAVSARIRTLETEVGQELIKQQGRQLVLTEAGRELEQHAQHILQSVAQAQRAMAAFGTLERGSLRIAASHTVGDYVLPQHLADFKKHYPRIQIECQILNEQQILQALRNEQIDLAISGLSHSSPELHSEPLWHNSLYALAAPTHPLARHRQISFAQFAQYPIITRETGAGSRTLATNLFRMYHFEPNIVLELTHNSAIKHSIIAGIGTGIISNQACSHELASGKLIRLPVEGLPIQHDWHIITRHNQALNIAAQAFKQQLQADITLRDEHGM
jgi:DNA-binding transcriptional LysR family regulator